MLLALTPCAQAADVTFHLADFGGAALASKKFQLTSLSTPRTADGKIIATDSRTITTDASGDVTTNLVYGNYRVDLSGSSPRAPTTSFIILVPDSTNAASATDLIATTSTIPGASVGYTQVASDGRYVRKTNSWSVNQVLTNATFGPDSTNAFTWQIGNSGDLLTTDGHGNWFTVDRFVVSGGLATAVLSLNGDTNELQLLTTAESGSDFAITTAGGTNLFSLPIASATKSGKLSAANYSTFYSKQPGTTNGTNWANIDTNILSSFLTSAPAVTNIVDAQIAVGAAIQESKISGLVSDLAGKQATNANLTAWAALATSAKQDADADLSNWALFGTNNFINSNGGTGTNTTLITPTIASFANANHNHQDSAGGGALAEAAVTGLVSDLAGKQASLGYTPLNVASNLSDVANAATARSNIGAGTGNGSVTSVAQTVPSQFQVTGSPVTGSGTLAITITNATGTADSCIVLKSNATVTGLTLAGSTTNSSLTASRPMKSDASKVMVSGQIDLSSANEVSGILNALDFPALTGDITTSSGALATTMKATGTAGTYRSVTFDAQGRETSGSNPTTFSGYGISDTSANLAAALSDETGAGLSVFNTNAVLVTPSISGPTTSGNWTNTATAIGTFTNTGPAGFSTNVTVGGQLYIPIGANPAPGLAFAGATNYGFVFASPLINVVFAGAVGVQLGSSSVRINNSAGELDIGGDTSIGRISSGVWQLGPSTFTRLDLGGTTAAFPAFTRSGAGLVLTGADGVASTTNNLIVPGTLSVTNGVSSADTTAAVSIASTGWTNTFGRNAVVYYDGTAITATVYNGAGTAIYTNSVALSGGSILLQTSGKVTLSGTSVTGRATVF
jgi:hypothetical protein